MPTQRKKSKLYDSAALEATAKQMVREGTMPSPQQLEAALDRIREKYAAEILQAREQDQMENASETSPSTPDS